jgi:hypothetical protein
MVLGHTYVILFYSQHHFGLVIVEFLLRFFKLFSKALTVVGNEDSIYSRLVPVRSPQVLFEQKDTRAGTNW